jgi:ribosome-associated protein YbcJ (S4-like RNA binding protein)
MQRGKKLHKGDKIEIKGINEIFVVDWGNLNDN